MQTVMWELTSEQLESVAGGLAVAGEPEPEPWRVSTPYTYYAPDPSRTPWEAPGIIITTRPGG